MADANSFASIGMISALLENYGTDSDYIDLLLPFILCTLPHGIGERVEISGIKESMEKEFGFSDMPHSVVKASLKKLTKRRKAQIPYLKIDGSSFVVIRTYDDNVFVSKREEMRQNVRDVLAELQRYLNEHSFGTVPITKVSEILSEFFDSYGISALNDFESLRNITNRNGKQNYKVAQFILSEKERRSKIYGQLVSFMKGFMAYKAMYVQAKNHETVNNNRYRNVFFFLDCSLVLDILGYDKAEDEYAVKELVRLIRNNGGQVRVFPHTIDEAHGVLTSFARNPTNQNAFGLPCLQSQNLTSNIILRMADNLGNDLQKQGVYAHEVEELRIINAERDNVIVQSMKNEDEIVSKLQSYSGNGEANAGEKTHKAYSYDAKSLLGISLLRKNTRPKELDKSHAVLVTQSYTLNRCLHELYEEEFVDQISYCINNDDLTCLLWLISYRSNSDLAEELLLSCAHAACELNDSIMKRAINLANTLAENGALSEAEVLTIRTEPSMRKYLFIQTENSSDELNEETIQSVIHQFVADRSAETVAKASLEGIQKGKSEARIELEKDLRAKDKEMDMVNDENTKLTSDLKIMEQKIISLENELIQSREREREETTRRDKEREVELKRKMNARNIASKKGKRVAGIIHGALKGILAFVLLGSIIAIVTQFVTDATGIKATSLVAPSILMIGSLLGLIGVRNDTTNLIVKLKNIIQLSIEERQYRLLITDPMQRERIDPD
ncbi:hypothetical protein LJC74_09920 [Eubacteriales bacterium OttesenSCG-928-A19]|nr:hypothetical protein [Eubacteriales bacterium OttesenSCG-928-A19]